MEARERYRVALLDWLACAVGGAQQPAARAAGSAGDGLLERVAWAGCAGHVLDYDDTYSPGLVHCSAPVAPVALLLAAELGRDIGAVLDAHAAGFELTAALSRAGHPALYDRGWHPTAVCGTAGAAVAAARLMALDAGTHGCCDRTRAAARRRPARGLRLGRKGAAGRHGGGGRAARRTDRAGGCARTARRGLRRAGRLRGGLRRNVAARGERGSRAPELDQGLPVLPCHAQRDRGRAGAAGRRSGARGGRRRGAPCRALGCGTR